MTQTSLSRRPLVAGLAAALLALPSATAWADEPPADPPLLAVGTPAPGFTAVAHDGQKVDLAKLRGKFVVLYFYPRDDTPGCTKEACDFRDSWQRLVQAGVVVFGVSTDGNESHKAFAEKHKLPFSLLPDEQAEIAGKYKVPIANNKARRITYLIGKDGKIKYVWPKVTPTGHAGEILAQIDGKGAAPAAAPAK